MAEDVDKVIADFAAIGRAIKQQDKFAATLANVNDKIKSFDDRKKINYQIKFICAINPNILTAVSGRGEKYATARSLLRGLIDFFKEELREDADFYDKINKAELASTQTLIDTLLRLLQENIKYKNANAEELEEYIKLTNTSVAQINGAVKERVKEEKTAENLEKQAEIFTNTSKKYKKNAIWFLVGAGGIFVVFVIAIFLLTYCSPETAITEADKAKDYIYFYIALKIIFSLRVLLSVILLLVLFASIRLYEANKHNAVVCDHRANTLKSYKALRDAAAGSTERLLVLQKILDAATDHQPSGFSKGGRGGDSQSSSLVEKALAALISSSKK